MPGDPEECREHAKACLQIAASAPDSMPESGLRAWLNGFV